MWLLVLIAALLSLTWYSIQQFRRWLTSKRFEREHGTVPAAKLNKNFLSRRGSYFKESMQAYSEHRLLELVKARHEAGGYTFQARMLTYNVIHTSEPDNIKAILAKNFDDYCVGFRMAALGPLLGEGIFTSDSRRWEHSRALVRPSFVKAQISEMGLFERHVSELLSQIPKNGDTVDLQELFFGLSCESSYGCALSSISSCIHNSDDYFT